MATEVLRATSEFEPADLGRQLHSAASRSLDFLAVRHQIGVIARYAKTPDIAEEKVRKGQKDHKQLGIGHFAVVADSGNVVGGASVYPNLPVSQLRLPVWPVLARGPLAVHFPAGVSPNVEAWVDLPYIDLLEPAYRNLRQLAAARQPEEPEVSWTTEPARSPKYVHDAIYQAGFDPFRQGRFDEQDSDRTVPPKSVFYLDPTAAFAGSHSFSTKA